MAPRVILYVRVSVCVCLRLCLWAVTRTTDAAEPDSDPRRGAEREEITRQERDFGMAQKFKNKELRKTQGPADSHMAIHTHSNAPMQPHVCMYVLRW